MRSLPAPGGTSAKAGRLRERRLDGDRRRRVASSGHPPAPENSARITGCLAQSTDARDAPVDGVLPERLVNDVRRAPIHVGSEVRPVIVRPNLDIEHEADRDFRAVRPFDVWQSAETAVTRKLNSVRSEVSARMSAQDFMSTLLASAMTRRSSHTFERLLAPWVLRCRIVVGCKFRQALHPRRPSRSARSARKRLPPSCIRCSGSVIVRGHCRFRMILKEVNLSGLDADWLRQAPRSPQLATRSMWMATTGRCPISMASSCR